MHGIGADATEAMKELENPPLIGAVLTAVEKFAYKLEYQFTPSLFYGDFWLDVAREMKLTRRKRAGCGQGHILLFRMREKYRRLRDFARPETRKDLSPEELEVRWKEAFSFCSAIVHVDRSK